MRYSLEVPNTLWWDEEDAAHIRSRSFRYSGATDIEPDWTLEAAADPARVMRDPDPKSRAKYPVDWLLTSSRVRADCDHRPGGLLRGDGVEDPRG